MGYLAAIVSEGNLWNRQCMTRRTAVPVLLQRIGDPIFKGDLFTGVGIRPYRQLVPVSLVDPRPVALTTERGPRCRTHRSLQDTSDVKESRLRMWVLQVLSVSTMNIGKPERGRVGKVSWSHNKRR